MPKFIHNRNAHPRNTHIARHVDVLKEAVGEEDKAFVAKLDRDGDGLVSQDELRTPTRYETSPAIFDDCGTLIRGSREMPVRDIQQLRVLNQTNDFFQLGEAPQKSAPVVLQGLRLSHVRDEDDKLVPCAGLPKASYDHHLVSEKGVDVNFKVNVGLRLNHAEQTHQTCGPSGEVKAFTTPAYRLSFKTTIDLKVSVPEGEKVLITALPYGNARATRAVLDQYFEVGEHDLSSLAMSEILSKQGFALQLKFKDGSTKVIDVPAIELSKSQSGASTKFADAEKLVLPRKEGDEYFIGDRPLQVVHPNSKTDYAKSLAYYGISW